MLNRASGKGKRHEWRFSRQACLACLLATVCLALQSVCAAADLRSNINAWKKAFAVVSDENPYVKRVNNIFERLKSVVGNEVLLSELYILDSDNQPWAIALADGNVVLSRGALDVVYGASNNSMEAKDAQIAFVLGHELNHIAKADFWHEQVYRSFVNREAEHHSVAITDRAARRRESELRADEDGFIYASLAGFNTRAILSDSENGTDFLQYWVRQTRTGLGEINFSAEERSQFLAITLRGMDEAVKLFQYGTRLAQFGFYDEARLLLDEFFRIYPSSQVLNNLGYVYLQLARLAMPVKLSAQYWFPFAIDEQSGVPDVSRSLSSALPDDAKSYLMKAVTFLSESIAQSGQYDSAVKNLAIAHLYLKEYAKARTVLEPAIAVSDDQQLLTLMAIAVLQDSYVAEPWQAQHRNELLLRASRLDASPELLYNTASLLQRTGFESQAASFWQRLGLIFDQLPKVYQRTTCISHRQLAVCQEQSENRMAQSPEWTPGNTTGIPIGSHVDSPGLRQMLKTWYPPFTANLSEPDIRIYEHPDGNSLLAINGVVTLINQRLHGFDFRQHLLDESLQYQQTPLVERQTHSASLLHSRSNWAAKVRDEEILEMWFADTASAVE
ncbi:MAG: M48 family metalloprotease [Granulosicoccus sp.]